MKQRFLSITGALIAAAALITATGCKEDTIVKASVAPGENNLGTQSIGDTITVNATNVFLDAIVTSEKITGLPVVQGLGTIVDPFLGKTNAGLYFQVLPTVNDFSFSASPYVIDSAVLILPYSGFGWGNRTNPKPQRLKVYRINEALDINTEYFSDKDRQLHSTLLGDAVINLQTALKDTPVILGTNAGFKHIRIPLSRDYIDDVLSKVGSSTFSSEAEFLSYFNGFYVMPDSTENMNNNTDLIPYILFDGGSDYSRVAVAFYYRENGGSISKVAFFNYVRDKTVNYNRITRNFNGFPVAQLLNRQTTDTLIVQNEPGISIQVKIPHLKELPQASIIKAELVLTKISSGVGADSLIEPNRLNVVGVNDAGVEYEIADYDATDINAAIVFVDGAKRSEKDAAGNDITTYRINIPREVQKAIIDKRNELHLRIKGAKGFPGAYRLVAGGRKHGTYKMQLNIVYAKPN